MGNLRLSQCSSYLEEFQYIQSTCANSDLRFKFYTTSRGPISHVRGIYLSYGTLLCYFWRGVASQVTSLWLVGGRRFRCMPLLVIGVASPVLLVTSCFTMTPVCACVSPTTTWLHHCTYVQSGIRTIDALSPCSCPSITWALGFIFPWP